MQNRFLSFFQTSRRLSATNWSWNPQGFWFTISQAARASGLETIFQLMREMIKKSCKCINRFGDEKYCVDKLWVGHNYSHVPEETLSNFAYVCLDVTQSVEEVYILFSVVIVLRILFFQLVNNFVYPIGVAVSMACLTLTFLLYLLLPQLRDLTG